MLSHPRRFIGLAVVALILAAGVGYASLEREESSGVDLLAMTDPIGEFMASPESAYVSFDLFPVCLSSEGETRIVAVEPIMTRGDIEVTDFSTVTYDQVGLNPSIVTARIRDTAYLQGPKTVQVQCLKGKPNDTELVVEIHVPERNAKAFIDGLAIRYVDGSNEKVTKVPITLGACRTPEGCTESDM